MRAPIVTDCQRIRKSFAGQVILHLLHVGLSLVAGIGLIGCEGAPAAVDIPSDGTPPRLQTSIVDFATALYCDPVADRPSEDERACMTPFLLGTSADLRDAGALTFITPNGAFVRSASAGMISDVIFLEHSHLTHSDIYSLSVRSNADAAFWVEYRNVKNLKVDVGDAVGVGQTIGEAADYYDAAVGSVSLSVRRQQELTQRICPTRYMSADVLIEHEGALMTSNDAWPAITHDALCGLPSVVCRTGTPCAEPDDFEPAFGDIDEGRRIYKSACASCHGARGQGDIASPLCGDGGCGCLSCTDPTRLETLIAEQMPPEGYCAGNCAQDVAAFILHELRSQ